MEELKPIPKLRLAAGVFSSWLISAFIATVIFMTYVFFAEEHGTEFLNAEELIKGLGMYMSYSLTFGSPILVVGAIFVFTLEKQKLRTLADYMATGIVVSFMAAFIYAFIGFVIGMVVFVVGVITTFICWHLFIKKYAPKTS